MRTPTPTGWYTHSPYSIPLNAPTAPQASDSATVVPFDPHNQITSPTHLSTVTPPDAQLSPPQQPPANLHRPQGYHQQYQGQGKLPIHPAAQEQSDQLGFQQQGVGEVPPPPPPPPPTHRLSRQSSISSNCSFGSGGESNRSHSSPQIRAPSTPGGVGKRVGGPAPQQGKGFFLLNPGVTSPPPPTQQHQPHHCEGSTASSGMSRRSSMQELEQHTGSPFAPTPISEWSSGSSSRSTPHGDTPTKHSTAHTRQQHGDSTASTAETATTDHSKKRKKKKTRHTLPPETICRPELGGVCPYIPFPPTPLPDRGFKQHLRAPTDPELSLFFGQVGFEVTPEVLAWLIERLTDGVVSPSYVYRRAWSCFVAYFNTREEMAQVTAFNDRVLFDHNGIWLTTTDQEQRDLHAYCDQCREGTAAPGGNRTKGARLPKRCMVIR